MALDLFRKTTVVNLKHGEQFDVYVGRPGRGQESIFGNPHPVSQPCPLCEGVWHKSDDAMKLFRQYFMTRVETDMKFRSAVLELKGKVLGCFCVRKDGGGACHALVIAEWIDSHV